MLGVPGQLANSGDGGAPAAQSSEVGGGGGGPSSTSTVGGFGQEEDLGDRSSGGNRWPRQETLALLKIRSDMDVAFRDSSLKGPLWEEVSRKLAELGYHRNAKKCKEKFENVYKYHKRTKGGRASKSDGGGKTYRFFDQLQALDSHSTPLPLQLHHQKPQPPVVEATPVAMAMPSTNHPIMSQVTFSATHPISISQINFTPSINPINPPPQPPAPVQAQAQAQAPAPAPAQPIQNAAIPSTHHDPMLNSPSSSSSSTSSDEEPERRGKRKRKWEYFFERLMKEVIGKQEEMQKKFLETLEKRERDRMAREEAWKLQEMARMNRDHDLLVQERSVAAAKDAAVIGLLQKISEQQQINPNASEMQMSFQLQEIPMPPRPPMPVLAAAPPRPLPVLQTPPPPPPPPQQEPQPQPQPQLQPQPQPQSQPQPQPPPPPPKNVDIPKTDNGGENFTMASSSRWPKAEVQALIKLRTNLDLKYQDNSPKGPLWEEISAAMRKLGYNRNAKRCKEKWENINKYFKKVKDSNKKRPEDSKTCPYFDQLDALYREKNKSEASSSSFKSESNPVAPIMVRPEQQWPGRPEDHGSENFDPNNEDNDDDDDEDEEDEGGGYEVVANKPSSMATVE